MSTPELFSPEEGKQDSPKLLWLKLHGFETEHLAHGGEECVESGDLIPHWVCRVIKPHPAAAIYRPHQIGGGDTEEEACAALAALRGLALWNEVELEKGKRGRADE